LNHELVLLCATAASLGLVHTLLGPDHYLPFVALSRARSWSTLKTTAITVVCGIGHVLSSVLLGAIGIALGVAVARMEGIESVRGDVAAWALTAFGLVYTIWGIQRAVRGRPHRHAHAHDDGTAHVHAHEHEQGHEHGHGHGHAHQGVTNRSLTPWVLFTIFVLGPCEPLIPILMVPAARESVFGITLVVAVFGLVTVATMLTVVLLLLKGLDKMPGHGLERYSHAAAGVAVLACGVAVLVGL
jgi:ABC-type nickel/cobalt efflux system permease component RcnA